MCTRPARSDDFHIAPNCAHRARDAHESPPPPKGIRMPRCGRCARISSPIVHHRPGRPVAHASMRRPPDRRARPVWIARHHRRSDARRCVLQGASTSRALLRRVHGTTAVAAIPSRRPSRRVQARCCCRAGGVDSRAQSAGASRGLRCRSAGSEHPMGCRFSSFRKTFLPAGEASHATRGRDQTQASRRARAASICGIAQFYFHRAS